MRIAAIALARFMTCAALALASMPDRVDAQDSSRTVLRRHFDRNLEKVSAESRRALPGLLLYEQDIREAILVSCQFPALVVRLRDLEEDDGAVDEVVEPYPDEIADGARLLATQAEILEILEENLVATAVVGRVYADDPEFIRRTVNRLAEEARAEHEASVSGWTDLLEEDPDLLEQLREASQAYADEQGVEEPEHDPEQPLVVVETVYDTWDDDWWYLTYGYWWVPGGIVIGDLPCGDFIDWILEHCDKFPDLGDRIIHHVRDRIENGRGRDFPGEMGDAFERWRDRNPVTTMQGFLNDDGQRAQRLRELGTARRELGGDRPATEIMQHVARNPERFPGLSRPAGPDRGRRDGGAAARPGADQRPGAGTGARPVQRPSREIRRHTPTQRQQMMRAVTRHRTAWRGAQPRPAMGRMPARGGGFRRR